MENRLLTSASSIAVRSWTRCTALTGMIIAPSERIGPTQSYGLWGDYNGERILNGGHWNVYKNGKLINCLNPNDVWNQNY